jgi:GntR family transcriptional regulator
MGSPLSIMMPAFLLDAESPVPLYYQLAQQIEQQIAQGQWEIDSAIPSERELMRLAGVSRFTVQQAIHYLVERGVVYRRHGKGTFVKRMVIDHELTEVRGVVDQLKAIGIVVTDRFIEQAVIKPTPLLQEQLKLASDEEVNYYKRVRSTGGVPSIIGISYIPRRLAPDLLERGVQTSIYRQLRDNYGLVVLRSVDTLESIPADAVSAELLQVPIHTPLMAIERIAYSWNDLPIQVNYITLRADMFRLRLHLQNQSVPLEIIGARLTK